MTKLFEKILLTTDGSDINQIAVKKALEIARECDSTIHAIYVIDKAPVTSSQTEIMTGELYDELNHEGEKAVENVKNLAEGVNVETFVLFGRPAKVITDFAEKNNIDLIVVGSHGKSGFERLILGSIAESIIRMAHCMVLVVKGK